MAHSDKKMDTKFWNAFLYKRNGISLMSFNISIIRYSFLKFNEEKLSTKYFISFLDFL